MGSLGGGDVKMKDDDKKSLWVPIIGIIISFVFFSLQYKEIMQVLTSPNFGIVVLMLYLIVTPLAAAGMFRR